MEGPISTSTGTVPLRATGGEQRRSDLQSLGKPKAEEADFELLVPLPSESGPIAVQMPLRTHPSRTISSVLDFSQLVASEQTGAQALVGPAGQPPDEDGTTEEELCTIEGSMLAPTETKMEPRTLVLPDIDPAAETYAILVSASNFSSDETSDVPDTSSDQLQHARTPVTGQVVTEQIQTTTYRGGQVTNFEAASVSSASLRFENPRRFADDSSVLTSATSTVEAQPSKRTDGSIAPYRQLPSIVGLNGTDTHRDSSQILAESILPLEVREGTDAQVLAETKITVVRSEAHLPPVAGGPLVQQIGRVVVAEIANTTVRPLPSDPASPGAPIVRTLELHLEPRELGPVTVRMSILDSSLRISLKVKDEKIAAQIEGSQRELAMTLRETGINLDELVVQAVYARQDVQGGPATQAASTSNGPQNGYQPGTSQGGTGTQGGDAQREQWGRDENKSQESQSAQTEMNHGLIRSGVYL